MRNNLSKRIWDILACPYCGNFLSKIDNGAICHDCHEEFGYSYKGQLDLRLRKEKSYGLQFELGTNLPPGKNFDFKILEKNPSPQLDFANIQVPKRLYENLMSYFPRAKENDSIMLDLGCGNAIHREVCEHAGFEYVGLDHDLPDALVLGDAHALPFKESSVEFILSIAVLEHIRYPFVMIKEAYRVLKPGGKFIGTVAFLETFHMDSFYHFTHLGILNLLKFAGFDIEYIAPHADWPLLIAQATNSLFPTAPRRIARCLVLPLHLLHRIWWKCGHLIKHSYKSSEKYRILSTTGAFTFIASKGEAK